MGVLGEQAQIRHECWFSKVKRQRNTSKLHYFIKGAIGFFDESDKSCQTLEENFINIMLFTN